MGGCASRHPARPAPGPPLSRSGDEAAGAASVQAPPESASCHRPRSGGRAGRCRPLQPAGRGAPAIQVHKMPAGARRPRPATSCGAAGPRRPRTAPPSLPPSAHPAAQESAGRRLLAVPEPAADRPPPSAARHRGAASPGRHFPRDPNVHHMIARAQKSLISGSRRGRPWAGRRLLFAPRRRGPRAASTTL